MAGTIHIQKALIPLLFLLIAVTSAIASSDPFEAKLGTEFLKAGPFGGNSSIEYSDLGDPHILQRRACPVGTSLCTSLSNILLLPLPLLTSPRLR